jgi:hypothetical protein
LTVSASPSRLDSSAFATSPRASKAQVDVVAVFVGFDVVGAGFDRGFHHLVAIADGEFDR